MIQPTDITRYDYLSIPARDTWGVIVRRDSPLAAKPYAEVQDLVGPPLIFSRQALEERAEGNELAEWFGRRGGSSTLRRLSTSAIMPP